MRAQSAAVVGRCVWGWASDDVPVWLWGGVKGAYLHCIHCIAPQRHNSVIFFLEKKL